MSYKNELEAFGAKYKMLIYLVGILVIGVTAWNTVVAQTTLNTKSIEDLTTEQRALEEKYDEIQDSVLIIQESQEDMEEDVQEIKADVKLLIRSWGVDR